MIFQTDAIQPSVITDAHSIQIVDSEGNVWRIREQPDGDGLSVQLIRTSRIGSSNALAVLPEVSNVVAVRPR